MPIFAQLVTIIMQYVLIYTYVFCHWTTVLIIVLDDVVWALFSTYLRTTYLFYGEKKLLNSSNRRKHDTKASSFLETNFAT